MPGVVTRYECPPSSGLVTDDYTGKPVKGAIVQVVANTSHPIFPEGSEARIVCHATVTTDENGIYTIPAWTNTIASGWDYYEQILISNPGEKPKNINPYNFAQAITPNEKFVKTVKWRLDPITRDELAEQEKRLNTSMPEDVLSNSLTFYTAHDEMVENGRFIDTPDLPHEGYIRPNPELVVIRIESFSDNVQNGFRGNGRTIEITLFPSDARKLEVLMGTRLSNSHKALNKMVVMLGDKPLSSLWEIDSHLKPSGYLFFRDGEDNQEAVHNLQKLVRSK